jgi:transcriptional regulator with XRE-family HTH domain
MDPTALAPIHIRVEELREAKGWSQAELARRSGVPQPTISRIEAGESGSISLANLERLADALGVDAGYLILHTRRGKRG